MKIKITFFLSLLFAVSLSAQKQYNVLQNSMVVEKPIVLTPTGSQAEAMAIDTVLPFPAACGSSLSIYRLTLGGYVMGTNFLGHREKAQLFTNMGTGAVTGMMVYFAAKEVVGTPDNISIKIYSGTATNGPGTLLGTSDPLSVANIDTSGLLTTFSFSNPVAFSGQFYASVEVSTGNDTVGMVHTNPNMSCLPTAWELWDDNSWNNTANTYGTSTAPFEVAIAMLAIVDDQLGSPCSPPTAITISNEGCDNAEVSWNTSGSGPSILEYGPKGFVPGSGTVMMQQSPFSITGLSEGMDYDIYMADTCGTDTSNTVGPVSFTTLSMEAAFTYSLGTATQNDRPVDFDASTSEGATSYSWDFDDGNTGSGATVQHAFSSNGIYDVCLAIVGDCGIESTCKTLIIEDVSLEENALSRSLSVFPNPTKSDLHITAEGSGDIRVHLRSLSGKELKVETYKNLNNRLEGSLDLSDLPKGVYLLEIKIGESSANRMIMKR